MKDSTRAVTIEIDEASAALAAQMERSARVMDAVATTIEAAGEQSRLTVALRREASAMRTTVQRWN